MPFKFSYGHMFLLEVDMTIKMWLKKLKKQRYILVFVYGRMCVYINNYFYT